MLIVRDSSVIRRGVGLKFFWLVGLLLLFIFFALYIFQVSQMTRATYLVGAYEKEINKLSGKNKALENNFYRAYSPAAVEELVKNLNFEPLGTARYIRIFGTTAVK